MLTNFRKFLPDSTSYCPADNGIVIISPYPAESCSHDIHPGSFNKEVLKKYFLKPPCRISCAEACCLAGLAAQCFRAHSEGTAARRVHVDF